MFLPSNVTAVVSNIDEKRVLQMKSAFGLMIKQLRLRDSLTIESLAEKADVLADELQNIECDPHYQARPRTVSKLAEKFCINLPKLMELSGVANLSDDTLTEEAQKFAAKSNGVSSLNNEEKNILNEFVKILNNK